jgi:hypothetical protein
MEQEESHDWVEGESQEEVEEDRGEVECEEYSAKIHDYFGKELCEPMGIVELLDSGVSERDGELVIPILRQDGIQLFKELHGVRFLFGIQHEVVGRDILIDEGKGGLISEVIIESIDQNR